MSIGGSPAVPGNISLSDTDEVQWKSSASAPPQDVQQIKLGNDVIWEQVNYSITASASFNEDKVTITVSDFGTLDGWKYGTADYEAYVLTSNLNDYYEDANNLWDYNQDGSPLGVQSKTKAQFGESHWELAGEGEGRILPFSFSELIVGLTQATFDFSTIGVHTFKVKGFKGANEKVETECTVTIAPISMSFTATTGANDNDINLQFTYANTISGDSLYYQIDDQPDVLVGVVSSTSGLTLTPLTGVPSGIRYFTAYLKRDQNIILTATDSAISQDGYSVEEGSVSYDVLTGVMTVDAKVGPDADSWGWELTYKSNGELTINNDYESLPNVTAFEKHTVLLRNQCSAEFNTFSDEVASEDYRWYGTIQLASTYNELVDDRLINQEYLKSPEGVRYFKTGTYNDRYINGSAGVFAFKVKAYDVSGNEMSSSNIGEITITDPVISISSIIKV